MLLSLVLLIPVGIYAVKASQFLPLDEVRKRALEEGSFNGSYLSTSKGKIAYRLHQNDDNANPDSTLVILVHGFSTPQFVFNPIVDTLKDRGYSVLTFDHFGRGFSDRPEGTYDENWYREELKEIVDHFSLNRPVHLVGYSMGGANVISYAARHPEQIATITLLAPAGFVPEYTGSTRLLLSPTFGPLLLTAAGRNSLAGDLERDVDAGRVQKNMLNQFEQQYFVQGTPLALARTLQNYPMYDLQESYQKAGAYNIPTTVVWGQHDQVTPVSALEKVKQAIPHSQHHVLSDATHALTYTDADRVAPLILQNLDSYSRE